MSFVVAAVAVDFDTRCFPFAAVVIIQIAASNSEIVFCCFFAFIFLLTYLKEAAALLEMKTVLGVGDNVVRVIHINANKY